jgi:hypothetical protein
VAGSLFEKTIFPTLNSSPILGISHTKFQLFLYCGTYFGNLRVKLVILSHAAFLDPEGIFGRT